MDRQNGTWQHVHGMGRSRRAHSCATLGNKVYVVGGYAGNNPSVEILTIAGDVYSVEDGPDLPGHVRTYGFTIAHQGVVYYVEDRGKVVRLRADHSGWQDVRDVGQDILAAVVTDYDTIFNSNKG